MTTKINRSTIKKIPANDGTIMGIGTGTGPGPLPGDGTSPGGSDTSPKIPKDRSTKTIKDK